MKSHINENQKITLTLGQLRRLIRESVISEKEDEEYLEAVSKNDIETLRKLIKKKANQKKYRIEAFHGTDEKFTVFDNSDCGIHQIGSNEGFFFSQTEKEAAKFATPGNKKYEPNWNELLKNTEFKNKEEYDKFGDAIKPIDGFNSRPLDEIKAILNIKDDDEFFTKRDSYFKIGSAMRHGEEKVAYSNKPNVMHVFLYSDRWTCANGELLGVGEERAAFLINSKASGYNGVKITDADTGGYYGTEYVVFKSNHIKLADPVTYDDDGNVIPLSKRFDISNPDIRY